MKMFFEGKKRRVEDSIHQTLENLYAQDELFEQAPFDPNAGEKTGYSNYSYWRSTFRAFLHNKTAVVMLVILVLLVLFTVIQPLLPGQYPANKINNNPMTGIQLRNQSPSATTVYTTVPAGTVLIGQALDEEWYAVSNVLTNIKKRDSFTVLEYGEDWCQVEYKGQEGYVKNNFQTSLKLPDDPTAVPYSSRSNFQIQLYAEPEEITNKGEALYTEKSNLLLNEDGTVTTAKETELRTIPSTSPFLFGTNNIGQDLWAQVWSGTRTSLWIGFVVALFEALIGIAVGIVVVSVIFQIFWNRIKGINNTERGGRRPRAKSPKGANK